MTIQEALRDLKDGSVINYKEFVLDRHERKRETLSIEYGVIQTIFQPNQSLSRDVLEQYYGDGLSDTDYLQLAQVPYPRLVINLGVNKDNQMNIKILALNQDFMKTGLQELSIVPNVNVGNTAEPNYLLAQRGW